MTNLPRCSVCHKPLASAEDVFLHDCPPTFRRALALVLACNVAVLLLTACPPRPTPPPTVPMGALSACPATAPVSADVCPGLFTVEGLACVRCPSGATGCIDVADQVYCVTAAGCLDDGRCRAKWPDGGVP